MQKAYYLTYAEDKDWAGKRGLNSDVLIKSLTTMRYHSEADIYLVLPRDLKQEVLLELAKLRVKVLRIPEEEWTGRRMFCRLENFYKLMKKQTDGTLLISSEADVFYLKDPYELFDMGFDLGLGLRPPGSKVSINSSVVFFRKSRDVVDLYYWLLHQIKRPMWKTYKRYIYRKNSLDNYCDRDIWWAVGESGDEIKEKFNVNVATFDCGYVMDESIENKKYCFHLKGYTKDRIYEKDFTERITYGKVKD